MKPTPCEHEWVTECSKTFCSRCYVDKPTPEEKCSHEWDDLAPQDGEIRQCVKCGQFECLEHEYIRRVGNSSVDANYCLKCGADRWPTDKPSPSPEASVEKLDRKSWAVGFYDGKAEAERLSAEARVDWEKEARAVWYRVSFCKDPECFTQAPCVDCESQISEITKALSAAFEKGREAR